MLDPNTIWRAADGRLWSLALMGPIAADDPEVLALGPEPAFVMWPEQDGVQTQPALDAVLTYHGLGAPAPASLPDITPRQFATGLWTDKVITFAECDTYVAARTIPAALQAILDALPDDDTGDPTPRKDATLLLRGAATFAFAHPLVDTIREAQGWTPEHLTERWAAWAAL